MSSKLKLTRAMSFGGRLNNYLFPHISLMRFILILPRPLAHSPLAAERRAFVGTYTWIGVCVFAGDERAPSE